MITPLDTYWAMEAGAFGKLCEQFKAILANPQSMIEAKAVMIRMADDADADGLPITYDGRVAIIHIDGVMLKRGGWLACLLGMSSTLAVRRAIETATADDDIGAILIRMDTPGGSVDGLAELGDAIKAAREVQPVIVQVDGMAASAGYYAASQADSIYAHRMDLVGSIGTRLMLYDYHKAFEMDGVEAVPIDSAPKDRPFKSAGVIGTEITKQQRADFQRVIDGFADDFKARAMEGRNMAAKDVDSVADGRVWLAPEAVDLGLIDGVQPLETTLASLVAHVARTAEASDGRSRMTRARARMMKKRI